MEEMDMNDISLIIRYFDLDLSEEEMIEFGKRLENEPSFAAKVKKYQESSVLVDRSYIDQDQRQRNSKWRELIGDIKTSSNLYDFRRIVAGAAAILLFLVSFWYLKSPSEKRNLENVAKQAWEKKVGFSDYQVRDNAGIKSKQRVLNAFSSYEKKDYESALQMLHKYSPSLFYYEDALLIRALSMYKSGKPSDALLTLDTLIKFPSGKLSKEARWYKGLIYLDLHDIESTKKYIELPNESNLEIRLKE